MVFAYSRLDMHHNRILPSQAFDLLSNDFNYYMLTAIIGGIVGLVIFVKKIADDKKTAAAWA